MIRNGKTELLLGERDFIKAQPILFDNKGMFIDGISINSPNGCYGPLYVTGDEKILDAIEALIKEVS